jgi:hypothetical protein
MRLSEANSRYAGRSRLLFIPEQYAIARVHFREWIPRPGRWQVNISVYFVHSKTPVTIKIRV